MSKRRESAEFDFKLIIDASRYKFPAVAKDIFAMANYGGGYILVGIKELSTGAFEPQGLPSDFHLDQADLQQKFNAYSSDPIEIGYREFEYPVDGESRRFALIYAPPSTSPLYPKSDGIVRGPKGRERTVFRRGVLLVRRGTQSIRASAREAKFIKKRCEETEYLISLISGNPDEVPEKLYSNFFDVLKLPDAVFSARLAVDKVPFQARLAVPLVVQSPYLYSFLNPHEEPMSTLVSKGSVEEHRVHDWLEDKDRRNILLWLLDSSLIWEARNRGMFEFSKKIYFPLREGETERREPWPGMVRKSSRLVATEMYASQLGETVVVHPSVSVKFTFMAEKLYLRLVPSYVLTYDGRRVRRGEEEGTVITRLSYDDYNAAYLRNVFFWMSQFGPATVSLFLLDGLIAISALPVTTRIGFGIRSDRPTLSSIKYGIGWMPGG